MLKYVSLAGPISSLTIEKPIPTLSLKQSQLESPYGVRNIIQLKSTDLIPGQLVEVLSYYDNEESFHARKIELSNDGSGVQLDNGFWANLLLNEDRVIKASRLGWTPDSDQTDYIFNILPQKLEGEGIHTVELDTGNITIFGNTTLPEIYGGVTFSGKGFLQSKTTDNILVRRQSQKTESKKYHGSYNVGSVFNSIVKPFSK